MILKFWNQNLIHTYEAKVLKDGHQLVPVENITSISENYYSIQEIVKISKNLVIFVF